MKTCETYVRREDQKQKSKVQEKGLKIDPSGFEIGGPRERVENSKVKGLKIDPFEFSPFTLEPISDPLPWKLSFSESGKFGPFFLWKLLCIG